MRPPNPLLIVCALAAFGCSKPPEAAFVDLEAIARRDVASLPEMPDVGAVPTTIMLPRTASLPPARSVTIQDLAEEKIDVARRLIDEDRRRALATLTARLKDAKEREITAEELAAIKDLENRMEAYWNGVYDELFRIFRAYALLRGPLLIDKEVRKHRTPELFPSRSSINSLVMQPSFAELEEAELRAALARLVALDDTYGSQATNLLKRAGALLEDEKTTITNRFKIALQQALAQVEREARAAIGPPPQSSDLNLGQNRSVTVPPVKGETVNVPGTSTALGKFEGLDAAPVTSPRDRRESLAAQLEIWLRTTGRTPVNDPSKGKDYTEVFDSWRKSHRLGL